MVDSDAFYRLCIHSTGVVGETLIVPDIPNTATLCALAEQRDFNAPQPTVTTTMHTQYISEC